MQHHESLPLTAMNALAACMNGLTACMNALRACMNALIGCMKALSACTKALSACMNALRPGSEGGTAMAAAMAISVQCVMENLFLM